MISRLDDRRLPDENARQSLRRRGATSTQWRARRRACGSHFSRAALALVCGTIFCRAAFWGGALAAVLAALPANKAAAQSDPVGAPLPAELRWGGDQEGGGPYIFPREDDPTQIEGFEVELAAALADELKIPGRFVQIHWDTFSLSLSRGDIDVALNGYEYTRERAARNLASIPYYVYELGLCARRDGNGPRQWDDLGRPAAGGGRLRVGVLGASAADKFVTERYGASCEVLRYTGSTEALRLVETGQLDATVQDLPILNFYVTHLKRHPMLQIVGEPAAPGYYVVYARPNDAPLIEAVNGAIKRLYQSGTLRRIYDRYGLWNAAQERLPEVWRTWEGGLKASTRNVWQTLWAEVPLFLRAAGVTVLLSILSMPLAVLIGIAAALARAWDTPILGNFNAARGVMARFWSALFTLYVELIRGTPLAFQLVVVYFVLPELGLTLSAFWAGVIALAVNYSAYEAEIMRLGLQAVPRGQMEAALALGMTRSTAVRRVILPQAVRIVIPATANDFIALFKDTAVCSVIAVAELSNRYSMGAKSTGLFLEMALLASVLYLSMSYPLSLLSAWLERRMQRAGVV